MFIVYSAPGCSRCTTTIKALERKGISYEVRSAEDSKEELKSMGFQSLPVVIPDKGEPFSGFRPDRLVA